MTASPPPSVSWLPYARRDWRRAWLLFREHDPDGAGIHLQQSVEKYLKGWLLDRGWVLRKTHEVDRLLDDAAGHDPSVQGFRSRCERLSSNYLIERYPVPSPDGPDEAQITTDISEARQLVQVLSPSEAI
jgi:HEPN domain-containing protein